MRTIFVAFAALGMAVSALAATRTVTETTDNGTGAAGSLSAAINSSADGDVIVFNLVSGDAVTLTAALPVIYNAVSIQGVNQATGKNVTVQVAQPGVSTFRVFKIFATVKTVAMENLILRGGSLTAANDDKGGVVWVYAGNLAMSGCTLRDGKANYGGGISTYSGTLNRCTITGNRAFTEGGGVYHGYGTVALFNSTVTGNYSEGNGGGMSLSGFLTFRLVNSTVAGNSAGANGGGVYLVGNVALRRFASLYMLNSVVVNNSATTSPDFMFGSSYASSYAYYSWYDSTKASGPITHTEAAAPNVNAAYSAGDLGELADNGGPTLTMALSATAPAVGTGTFAYINTTAGYDLYYFLDANGTSHNLLLWATSQTVVAGEKVTTDQRGEERLAPADMGAFSGLPAATDYTLTASAGANGSIEPSGAVTVAEGADQTFTFTPDAWYRVASVLVDGASVGAPASYVWTNAAADGTIEVLFAEQFVTNNTPVPVPERWMAQYGLTNGMEGAVAEDSDNDGMTAWAEYVAGTDPTNPLSRFAVANYGQAYGSNFTETVYYREATNYVFEGEPVSWPGGWITNRAYEVTGFVVGWPSVTGRVYSVKSCTSLSEGLWTDLPGATGLLGVSPSMVYTNPVSPAVDTNRFFRVKVAFP